MRQPSLVPQSLLLRRHGRGSATALLVLLVAVAAAGCGAGAGDGDAVLGGLDGAPAAAAAPAGTRTGTAREGVADTVAGAADRRFDAFWDDFRRAALAGDGAALVAMSDLPFHTRGPSDDDPLVARDSAAFLDLVPRLLAEDPGLSAQPSTMRALLEGMTLPPADAVDGDEARVGGFVFVRRDGRWRFARAYLSDP